MTGRERVERASAFEAVDRVPFVPAVYEHKARLVGRSPSEVCRSLDLLLEALARERELYGPDALTVGLDVYNVEAEAAGCAVRYFDGGPGVPAVAAPLLAGPGDLIVVPTDGGPARALTTAQALYSAPCFSPDGRAIFACFDGCDIGGGTRGGARV
ncbi:MAG: hypothetical protein GX465_00560, partial [Acidobacteria bacterium]|nr:hypothetical protein [Acidobacteriota bacterium]